MPVARKTVVDVDQVGVYHCISRCLRRAFLCGVDSYTGTNYEHRRAWITERWVRNVESYGGLFYRIAGPLESIVARAREKGLRWLRGQKGSRELYQSGREAA